jgi:hypothetical protein
LAQPESVSDAASERGHSEVRAHVDFTPVNKR